MARQRPYSLQISDTGISRPNVTAETEGGFPENLSVNASLTQPLL
jgi:hypothetical protein